MNKIILSGRITHDIELSNTQSGVAFCKFTIASNRKYADKATGERQADFINCVAWRGTAEFISKYFQKGSAIIAEGTLQNNNYESNGVKYYSYVVQVDSVEFGGSKSESNTGTASGVAQQAATTSEPENIDLSGFEEILSDGDLPF
jgi:single-strand DNA-binding protein